MVLKFQNYFQFILIFLFHDYLCLKQNMTLEDTDRTI